MLLRNVLDRICNILNWSYTYQNELKHYYQTSNCKNDSLKINKNNIKQVSMYYKFGDWW